MEFSFDEQQVEFRSQLRTFLDRECTALDVRAAFGGPTSGPTGGPGKAPARRRWEQLAEMGVVGLTAPETEGGLGLGAVDLVCLLEESGWAALPEPLAETTGLVVPMLADISSGDPGDAERATARHWLRLIAAGDAVATVVPSRGTPAVWGDGPDGADVFVVVSSDRIVIAAAGEVDVTPVGSIDPTRRLATVVVHDGAGSVLCEGEGEGEGEGPGSVADVITRLHRRGAFSTAAVLLGAADRLISFACGHALERRQFGRPIGSFQAVKHHLADAYVALEMARPVVYRAAWSLDQDADTADRDCSMAKSVASDAALLAARIALQVHGAMGYTWEHDLHMWMKRVWFLAASWGDSATHLAALLDDVARTGDHTRG